MQNYAGIDVPEFLARLQAFALGDDPNAMSDAEVAAVLAVLNAALPDLAEVVEVEITACARHLH